MHIEHGIMDISIEMNLSQVFIIRNYYAIFDLLADIGGTASILMITLGQLLSVLNYMNF